MWFLYSLLCAFCVATSDALSKRAMMDAPYWLVGWVRLVYALPFLLLGLCFIELPPLDTTFWLVIVCLLPLELGSYVLYLRAIRSAPLSTTLPLLSFTPLFLTLSSYLILGERVNGQGLAGIALIAAGSYFLNLHEIRSGWLGPLRALVRQRGARDMLGVALIYSVTSVLGKVGLQHSSPAFFAIVFYVLLGVLFTPLALWKTRPRERSLAGQPVRFALIGFFYFCMVLFHYLALDQVAVPYMISIKRTSMVFSVLYGWLLFRESRIRERLLSCALMAAGAALLSLA
ncbi:MAG: DMT family transporter [Acidobacteriota bacterium]